MMPQRQASTACWRAKRVTNRRFPNESRDKKIDTYDIHAKKCVRLGRGHRPIDGRTVCTPSLVLWWFVFCCCWQVSRDSEELQVSPPPPEKTFYHILCVLRSVANIFQFIHQVVFWHLPLLLRLCLRRKPSVLMYIAASV